MELLRTAVDARGGDVLVGIGRGLVWLAVGASVAFVVAHLVWAGRRRRGRGAGAGKAPAPAADLARLPRRIPRHTPAARLLHWTMSAAMLVLLLTGFVPILGLDLPWVTLHWGAGLVLFLAVAWHVIHALGWQDLKAMWIGRRDVHEGVVELRHALSSDAPSAPKPGKYPAQRKVHHQLVALVTVVALPTGLLMTARIDTPLWPRDPSLLADATWGWVYVAHGVAAVGLVGLVTAHVYLALRRERRWLTWSMVRGWITREQYLAHHDPRRWPAKGVTAPPPPPGGALADATVRTPREEA